MHPQKLVVYDQINMVGSTIAKLNVAIAGHNAGLPDTYGRLERLHRVPAGEDADALSFSRGSGR